jgi:iron complex outermembrane receptor protein
MKSALNVVRANQKFIEENFSGSLMQTLSRLPGVQAMNVGSGESKPVIRGLGFNRVLVAENGIKHEGQQWGDDHGLEIDQYAIDQAEVIKGPASLTYGSDAIGGVINLKSNTMPLKKFAGQVNLFGRTNNESIGSSVRLTGRNGKFWYKANATWMDYADYKVPDRLHRDDRRSHHPGLLELGSGNYSGKDDQMTLSRVIDKIWSGKLWDFHGGIHPEEHKLESSEVPLAT